MNGRSLSWVLSQTILVTASIVLAVFISPTNALATNLGTLDSISVGGAAIQNGATVTRDSFSSISNQWTTQFSWTYPVPNARAGIALFRGSFGALDGGAVVQGQNYALALQAWGTGVNTVSKQFLFPMLGALDTPSGTYTVVVADLATAPDMYNKFAEWFGTGGAQGFEPNHYRTLTFYYDATSTPTALPDALTSVQYGSRVITEGVDVLQESVTPNINNPSGFWRFNFDWPSAIPNQRALFMVFKGTYGALDGGAPVSGTNYAATVQAWAAGSNAVGKFMSLAGLETEAAPGTYTVMVAERDAKYSANSTSQEALWFASGGTQGVAPRAYSLLTFTLTAPPKCCSSVLFLPGIESSRLYRPDYAGGTDRLWEPGENQDIKDLYLDEDGDGLRDDVYAKVGDVLDETPTGSNVYKTFISRMNSLKQGGVIHDWQPIAYDWRLSLDDILASGNEIDGRIYYTGALSATSTPYILQEIRRLARESRTHKVTIVAHSNGGLLTKRLTEVLGPEASTLIDRIILVAVPQAGTPQALAVGLHGYEQQFGFGLVMSKGVARSFASTSPMFYNLLPSDSYYTYVDDPVASFDASLPDWQARYGDVIHSGARQGVFISDTFGRVESEAGDTDQPIQLSQTLFADAQSLHAHLDTWSPPSGVEVVQIAGWGVPDTLKGVTYTRKSDGVRPLPEFTFDGDGTVVTPSALWTSGVQNYWLNLNTYNRSNRIATLGGLVAFDHASVLEVDSLLNYLIDTLSDLQPPTGQYPDMSENVPIVGASGLRFSLHSPLSLDLYDSAGRHTGISKTTGEVEEEIPGTYYTEFGDVKYIFSDSGTPLRVSLDGYDTGTFTLNVDEYLGGAITASSTFKDIPTTPNTLATISTSGGAAELTPLTIDSDGNGTTDITLSPKLNSVVTLDVIAPVTTHTLVGTSGLGDWFVSPVSVELVATDDDTGVARTYYALDGAPYAEGNAVAVDTEGVHTLTYYSVDQMGNSEVPVHVQIKLDTASPEVTLGASVATKDLQISGTDTQSTSSVVTTGNVTLLTDQAGHTTKLVFQKAYSSKRLSYAKLQSIAYDSQPAQSLPSSFTYLWDTAGNLVSQTVVADSQFAVQALYNKSKNKTVIVVLKKNTPVKTATVSGLAIIKLTTNKGVVSYSW